MAIYKVNPDRKSLRGSFSIDFEPVLTINSGDSVQYRTLDAGWGYTQNQDQQRQRYTLRNEETDRGHALCGPIFINGAHPGLTLEIRINDVVPGLYGFTSAGHYPNWQNTRLGLTDYEEITLDWKLNKQTMIGKCSIQEQTYSVDLHPFMGVLGMPPNESGIHSTAPPRYCGGNIDCKELTKGSSLYLPISVEGALFSIGDGHAAQGDGEISGQAIECPMDLVDVTFVVRDDILLTMPRANTPNGWLSFGFHEDLNEATVIALDGMLQLMEELFGINRVEAMALGSSVVDLRITQIVNGVKGVHACLPHGALRFGKQ